MLLVCWIKMLDLLGYVHSGPRSWMGLKFGIINSFWFCYLFKKDLDGQMNILQFQYVYKVTKELLRLTIYNVKHMIRFTKKLFLGSRSTMWSIWSEFILNATIVMDEIWFLRNKCLHELYPILLPKCIRAIRNRYREHKVSW